MTPDQVATIVQRLLDHGVSLNFASYLGVMVLAAVVAVVAGLFAAYLGEKGASYSTREAFADLVEQLSQTTTAIDAVKPGASNDTWLRQQLWTEKRRLYAELLQAFHGVRSAAQGMAQAQMALEDETDPANRSALQSQIDAHASNLADAKKKVMELACTGEIIFSADASKVLNSFRSDLFSGGATQVRHVLEALAAKSESAIAGLVSSARVDLGLAQAG